MNKWSKELPKEAGWYWAKNERLFKKPTPIEIRIIKYDQLHYGKFQELEWWNPNTVNWELLNRDFVLFKPVENAP